MSVMIVKTLNAMSVALHEVFGDTFHYYVEDIKQNLTKPCFTINMIEPLTRSVNHLHYYRTMPMVIHYFPVDKDISKAEAYAVAERAFEAIEYIVIEDRLVRAVDMSCEYDDGVLSMYATYRFWTKVPYDPTYMEDLKVLERVNN